MPQEISSKKNFLINYTRRSTNSSLIFNIEKLHILKSIYQFIHQILLDYKSDPSYQDEFTENLWTPIHEASNRGLTWILEQFLQTDCDLDVRTEDGATPTYVSCQYGQTECLQLLLDHGANAEIRVDTGETPLHIACQEGHYECVVTLLNHGKSILNVFLHLPGVRKFHRKGGTRWCRLIFTDWHRSW